MAVIGLPNNDEARRAVVLLVIVYLYALVAGAIAWLLVGLTASVLKDGAIKNLTNIIYILFAAYKLVGERNRFDVITYIFFIIINGAVILYYFKKGSRTGASLPTPELPARNG
jgi:hypothetical protein